MARALVVVALAGAVAAGPAAASVFRCIESHGAIRFVDSPHACPLGSVESQDLARRVESLPSAPPPEEEEAADESRSAPVRSLAAIWLSAAEIGLGWDVVREAPIDPADDPDLVAWGVRAQDARHYTRDADGSVQVCSVELWTFADEARTRAAHQGFAYPDWRIEREGNLLLMLRGVTITRGSPPQRGIFEDCSRIGDRIQQRAGADPKP